MCKIYGRGRRGFLPFLLFKASSIGRILFKRAALWGFYKTLKMRLNVILPLKIEKSPTYFFIT